MTNMLFLYILYLYIHHLMLHKLLYLKFYVPLCNQSMFNIILLSYSNGNNNSWLITGFNAYIAVIIHIIKLTIYVHILNISISYVYS